ncbi:MAG: hypothetical protein JWO46_3435 [Nocardioidaceae bacterium]|nr:hypothetical protein [Nocardioidaceae bacterium]
MTSGRHAAPSPQDEGYDGWLSAPAHAAPPAVLSGTHGRRSADRDDWAATTAGPAPAFEDAFVPYTSQTASEVAQAPTHAATRVTEDEPDPWPTVVFSADRPAWEAPREDRDRPTHSHRRTSDGAAASAVRSHPMAFGLVGLLVGLAVSALLIKVVSVVFPNLLPSL